MPRYIVQSANACMPASCKGRYRRVAVLELEPGFEGYPKMISNRARGVARIVACWEKQSIGRTDRCAYARAYRAALELAENLNFESALAEYQGA